MFDLLKMHLGWFQIACSQARMLSVNKTVVSVGESAFFTPRLPHSVDSSQELLRKLQPFLILSIIEPTVDQSH